LLIVRLKFFTGNPAVLSCTGPVAFRPTITHGLARFLLFYPCLRSGIKARTWQAAAFQRSILRKKLGVKCDRINRGRGYAEW